MFKIRSFEDDDYYEVRALFERSLIEFSGNCETAMRSYVQSSLSDDLIDIRKHYFDSLTNHFWVAEVDGLVKGMAGIQSTGDGTAELRRMSVDREMRRLGIGSKLLSVAEDFCNELGHKSIRLTTVNLLVPAIALYENCGFALQETESYGDITGLHYVKTLKHCERV